MISTVLKKKIALLGFDYYDEASFLNFNKTNKGDSYLYVHLGSFLHLRPEASLLTRILWFVLVININELEYYLAPWCIELFTQ